MKLPFRHTIKKLYNEKYKKNESCLKGTVLFFKEAILTIYNSFFQF